MFAKLKKRIEEETESGLAADLSEISNKFPRSSSQTSIPDLHCKTNNHARETEKAKPKADNTKQVNKQNINKATNHSPVRQLNLPESKLEKQIVDFENKEEIQDFQKQEVSKVKHLLLLCENELKSCKDQLGQREEELLKSNHEISTVKAELEQMRTDADGKAKLTLKFESIIEKLTESNTQMIVQLEEQDHKIKKLTEIETSYNDLKNEQTSNAESFKSDLINEKSLLIEEIDQMKKKNLECSGKISYLESLLNDRLDEFEALKHTHDTYRTKTSSILEDKDMTIQNLEERVKILEKRVTDSSLCDDEKMQSIVQERNHLEQMLDESRHHLSEIKISWSDKITNLETQIAHLNRKMAEDSDDSQKLEAKCRNISNELDSLRLKNNSLLEENEDLCKAKNELKGVKEELHHCKTERNRLRSENDALSTNVRSLRNDLNNLNELNKRQETENKVRVDELMSQRSEHVEKEIENENKISDYEATVRKLKTEGGQMEGECSVLKEKLASVTETLEKAVKEREELSIQVKECTREFEEKNGIIESLEIDLESVQQERDSLLMRNSELSQQSEFVKQRLNEEQMNKDKIQTEIQESNDNLVKETKELKTKMRSLEASASKNVENSVRVAELKTSVVDLESQLVEKNKVIKLQQQRLADMKKTLVKELKMQQPNDSDCIGDGLDISLLGINKLSRSSTSKTGNYIATVDARDVTSASGNDINIQYLRHVVFKFMTSREYEAQQLIKAVSMLLKFTAEQENLIKETLDWKMSWFGHKPSVRQRSVKS